jgi:predicted ribosome quality control (RQC) complex YloA/Tae2 family protein
MEDSWEEQWREARRAVKRRVKTGGKSLQKALGHLEGCRKWQEEHHAAELLQSNLYQIPKGAREAAIWDWEQDKQVTIALDPHLKPHEEAAKRFKKAKKLKAGLPHAEREWKRAQDYANNLENQRKDLEGIDSEEKWIEWLALHPLLHRPKQALKAGEVPAKPYWEYLSQNQILIWVGKNASANDALTFQHARGNDPWLHVADFPGSHVVIRSSSQDPDQETLKDALQLSLYHSKARHRKEAEVSLTHVKYVKRFGREKGKVQIAHEKRFFVRLDPERISRPIRLKSIQARP